MYGTLTIKIAVAEPKRNKLMVVYTTSCTREAADTHVTQFKYMNPELKEAIATVKWQAEAEYL